MFGALWKKIKEMVQKMLPKKSLEEVLHVTPVVSDKMADAIELWSDLYEGKAPWLHTPTYTDPTRVVSLGLPAMIASEKARMVTLEMKSEVSAPMQDTPIEENPDLRGMIEPTTGHGPDTRPGPVTEPPVIETNAGGGGSQPSVGNNADRVPGGNIEASKAYQVTTTKMPAGPTERAAFLNKYYQIMKKQLRRQLEYGIAKGGLVIKPYIIVYDDADTQPAGSEPAEASEPRSSATDNASRKTSVSSKKLRYGAKLDKAEIMFDFVQADRFFPLAFDANGKVVEAAFVQTKTDKARERVFIRIEYHKLNRRTLTVQNLAFESKNMELASAKFRTVTDIGNPIPLTAVPEWANLQPETTIENVDRLLFAYFKMPEANTIDPYSPLGVSGYSRVVNLIKDADEQYSRLLWEFEGGEMAIDVDRDALQFVETNEPGKPASVLPKAQQRLFRKVDLNNEETYNVFAPTLRDQSITHGLNTIFMRIEDACGLSRGTLSDVNQQEAKTATELKILKQRSYATNADIQQALQDALEDVVYSMDVYCDLYDVTPRGEYEISFEWDDSIIVDSESELSKRMTLMQAGIASKLETRMWYYGETENQAKAALQQVDQEATEAMMQNVQADMMKAAAFGHTDDGGGYTNKTDKTSDKSGTTKQNDSLDNPDKSQQVDKLKS